MSTVIGTNSCLTILLYLSVFLKSMANQLNVFTLNYLYE